MTLIKHCEINLSTYIFLNGKNGKKNILDFCDAVQNSKLSIEELNKWYKTISTNINIHLLKDTPPLYFTYQSSVLFNFKSI